MTDMWRSIRGVSISGDMIIHIVPLYDMRKHELTAECWCEPELDFEHLIATHHSADGREKFETGERKVS